MSLKARRILFILFILIFFMITPLVISYAAGYKFVFGKKILQKTGMLIINSEPKGAKIYLDDKPQQLFLKKFFKNEDSFIVTPAKIKNVLPGEYNIKLELDGYYSWGKKLEIKPGISTFAEDINLFKENLPLLINRGEINKILPSLNNKYLAVANDENIILINLETEEAVLNIDNTELNATNRVLWSPNSQKILINNEIYNINNIKEKKSLNNIISANPLDIKWGEDNTILYINGLPGSSKINSLNLDTDKISTLATDIKIINFLYKNNRLFFINEINGKNNLIVNEVDSTEPSRSIELPSYSNFKFINPDHRLINLYDSKHQILYLIDPFSSLPLKEIINNIKYTYWVNDNKLLYANDFEIWLANLSDNKKTLLTRISNEINNIIWHTSNNYIIYLANNSIYTIELDDREKHNITKLINLGKISFLYLNNTGDTLYFYAKIGNQEGLYKLNIQ